MKSNSLHEFLVKELNNLEAAGLLQESPALGSTQGAEIQIGSKKVVNFASDDYLGWSHDERLIEGANEALEEWGTGWSSGRLFSGTHELHRKLEAATARFLGAEDAVVFASEYLAGAGLFESLFDEQDFLLCDFALEPSVVDGVRLSAARSLVFKTQDLGDLEDKLKRSPNARFRAIVIEAVSSNDGRLAPLPDILALARKYQAITIVNDPHGPGVLGKTGRGIVEELGLADQIDILVGGYGHALGGASGGYVAGRKAIISWLRQKSRTYLFSESPAPAVIGAALKALSLVSAGAKELTRLRQNTENFRKSLAERGFDVTPSVHPIVSIVTGDALVTQKMANRLFQKGFYVMGFCYPVVPRGSARIRLQISASHSDEQLNQALEVISEVARALKV